ncbi:MAG TPA: N-acetylmuramoyl-L-alanine amidase [Thermoanaerobaculia bacterium]|nr:N-acetylmuramoyl-L-alanine amidase [Thermoanaerobaculia bacterium]
MRALRFLLLVALLPSLLHAVDPTIGWDVRPADPRGGIVAAEARAFEAAAVSWSATREIAIRVRVPGGEWIEPLLDDDLTSAADGRWFTGIVHFGAPQSTLEYAFDAPEGVRDLRVTLFVPPEPRREVLDAVAPTSIGALGIVSRTQWGCPDGQNYRGTPAYTNVTHVIVHHTAGSNTLTDWAAEVRNIWYYHTGSNGWDDVGYHWLIDPNGVIYEGRAGGHGVIGAHFSCRNSNTAGIALLGTFTSVAPTEAALAALTRLTGEVTARWGIAPGAFVYHAPSKLNLQTVSGHRDGNTGDTCTVTECPGDRLFSYLPVMRSALASCEHVAFATTPDPVAITAGGSTVLRADVAGTGPFTYQWYAGAPGDVSGAIAGATGDSITVSPTAGASYWVRVANVCGAADSPAFVVTMGERPRGRFVRR